MKNKLLYIGLSLISICTLNSCKNDLDVLAPGEESVSVYGVLNPNATVQNIRINKVYLTDGDAIVAGQEATTINYDTSELRVSLQRFLVGGTTPTLTTVGNASKKEIVLTGTLITTASGNFSQNQTIWQTSDMLYNTGEYKLTIKIKSTGKEITSQTTMCDSVRSYNSMPFIYSTNAAAGIISAYPNHCNGYIYPTGSGPVTSNGAFVNYSTPNVTQRIKFKSVANARLYEVVMRFHYIDSIGGVGNKEYVDFNFGTQKSSGLGGGEPLEVSFNSNDFYTNLATEISKKPAVSVNSRTAHYMEYIITAGNETLNTFLQVNAPSSSIAQDKPNYSNINGGVGVFASKSKSSISKNLLDTFIDEIANNSKTNNLLFNHNYIEICP